MESFLYIPSLSKLTFLCGISLTKRFKEVFWLIGLCGLIWVTTKSHKEILTTIPWLPWPNRGILSVFLRGYRSLCLPKEDEKQELTKENKNKTKIVTSNVFRGYQKRSVAWNGLKISDRNSTICRMSCKYRANIYLLKVNNRDTRTRCEICSKLTKIFLTLNIFHTLF